MKWLLFLLSLAGLVALMIGVGAAIVAMWPKAPPMPDKQLPREERMDE